MNIPQVNALATDRNREQSLLIARLNHWRVVNDGTGRLYIRPGIMEKKQDVSVELPNGSFALNQVVGMLEAEGVAWRLWPIYSTRYRKVDHRTWGWGWPTPFPRDGSEVLIETGEPYNLTAAMDALIKVLEAKQ